MHWFGILLLILLTLIIYQRLCYLWNNKLKKLPPGPKPLPIIGNLHLLDHQPHKSFARLSKKYGPILSLKLGFITTIIISSSSTAKEILKKQDLAFSNRSIPYVAHAHNHTQFSVVWLPVAPHWRRLRKIIYSYIFSNDRLEDNQHLRRKMVHELFLYCKLKCQNGEAIDMAETFFRTTLNLLSNTIFSKDFVDPYSNSASEFKNIVWSIMEGHGKANLADFFPFLTKIDLQGMRKRMETHFEKLCNHFRVLIDERLEQKRSRDGVISDVLDILLSTNAEGTDRMDTFQILNLCLDLFVAGTDTTSSTLEWAMAEMLQNPDKMKKTQSEIAEIIGKGKRVDETDVINLPYLRCVVKETLRLHPAGPFLIPRKVEQDMELCGYRVPKGSRVLVNAWAIGRDETVWEEPLLFKPERFLKDSELDFHGKEFELVPFGGGRRICPGLPLVTRVIPVIIGSLLNLFNWEIEGGVAPKDMDMEEKFGLTLQKAVPLRAVPFPI